MDPFDTIANWLAGQLGLSGTSLIATLVVISLLSRYFGKLIPDDATGFMAGLRKVLKAIGLYASNRVSSGVSTDDIAAVLAQNKTSVKDPVTGQFTSQTIADAAKITNTAKVQSPWWAGTSAVAIAAFVLMVLLSGCTANQVKVVGQINHAVCDNLPLAQSLLDEQTFIKDPAATQKVLDGLALVCPLLLPRLDLTKANELGAKVPVVATQTTTVQ